MRKSNSFAKQTAAKLSVRHKQTEEVKDILTGAGFKKVLPSYTSQPDIKKTEIHH